ncbi:MAG: polysaccharide deacetylase family protein [Rheinheimera sp.]|nr:polysaccharide deacetylase family protein [Rheinheimera sp.]
MAGIFVVLRSGHKRLSSRADFQLFGELVYQVQTEQKVIALTFDDGRANKTEQILQILAAEQVPATFFLVGEALERNPELAKKLLAAGHQLGNHSYSHQRMLFKSPEFIASEIEKTDALLRDVGVTGQILFRPPYGKKLVLLPWYLATHQRVAITWDVAPENYRQIAKDSQAIVQHCLKVQPGSSSCCVMYEPRRASMQAIPELIKQLKAQGYRFVTVDELLAMRAHTKSN